MKKRVLSYLSAILLIAILATTVAIEVVAIETKSDFLTRAQWISELVKTFDMEVEEENAPDNYFSDLTGEEEYYRDILVAVEFGVIDIEAGYPFEPNVPVSREFAAHTMNFCLGFQLAEDSEYTYSESAKVTYPDDIQIALNRGWFKTINGEFRPQQVVTQEEKTAMLNDAAAVLQTEEVDVGYDSSYVFTDEVIVIAEGSSVQLQSENTIVMVSPDVVPAKGDIFAAYFDGLPFVYQVDEVSKRGMLYTFTVTELEMMDYLQSIDAQGVTNSDLANFKVAEGFDAVYVLEDNTEVKDVKSAGTKKIKSIYFYQTIGDLTVNINLYEMKLDWRAKGNVFNKKSIDVMAVVSGKTKCSASLAFGASASGFSDALTLGTYPIGTLGEVSVKANISVDGSVTVSYGADFSVGVSYTYAGGFRLPKDFKKSHFSLTVEANIDFGLTVSAGIYKVPFLTANCSATIGMKTNFVARHRGSDKTPKLCIHTDSWLYAKAGIYASVGIDMGKLPGADNFKESWNKTVTLWDRNNSPVRSITHFEDGTRVDSCTYGETNFFGYSTGYYSWSGSRYNNGGVSAVNKSPFTYKLDEDGNATITGYSGNVWALSIPATIDGHKVTAIGSKAFKNKSIRTVTLPEGVVSLGSEAFYGCTNLSDVFLPKMLTTIGDNAFYGCSSIYVITIPDSVTKIGNSAFSNCRFLSRARLSNNLTDFGYSVFKNCVSLTEIKIPKTLKTCSGKNNASATDGIFYGCTNLKNITIEDGMTHIPDFLLQGSSIEYITIPESVTSIGICVFRGCEELKEIIIPDSVTKIGNSAFSNCRFLSKVKLSNNLTDFGQGVFKNCISLTEITIPKTVTYCTGSTPYTNGIFYGCTNLKNITLEDGMPKIAGSLLMGSSIEQITIPETVTKIEQSAFFGCKELKEITIPVTVKEIYNSAFSNCTSLETLVFPDTVSSVGTYVAEGCTNLKSVTWTKSLNEIPGWAFEYCESLTTVILSENVTHLGKACFFDCDSLATITLPNSLTSIGDLSFKDCDALTTITIPENVTKIGSECFYDCDALETVKMSDKVTEIGLRMFEHCDVLKNVYLSKNITAIYDSTFKQCAQLEEITVPYYVTQIGNNAFNSSPKLKKVVLPRGLQKIGTTAFSYADTTVIYGVAGTYAESWAKENGFTFVDNQIAATGVSLEFKEINLNKGKNFTLNFTTSPEYITDEIFWKSSDTSVVTVSDKGVLKAVGVGTATIKLNVGNVSASCKVTVVQPITGISLNKSSLSLNGGESFELKAKITPSDAFNKEIIWESSDPSVATVDQNGVVTALKKGTATITVTANDGSGVTQTCKVTVINTLFVITDINLFESPHPYENSCSDSWVYTEKGASNISVTFDERTTIEDGFDYLYIYDGNDNLIGKYTGTELSGAVISIPGNTVKIKLETDNGGSEWGFKVTSVTAEETPHVHSYGNWTTTIEATCVADGAEERTCSVCGRTETRSIPATGDHVWGEWKTTVEPTVTTDGKKIRVCSVCGGSEKQSIPVISGIVEYPVEGGYIYFDTDTGTITRCDQSVTEANIPSQIYGATVTSIGGMAFYNCTLLTSITIPNSVTSIGDEAFEDCDSLTSIIIPDSVKSLGYGMFWGCDSLTSITIPDSVNNIGAGAFGKCTSLTSITIPDSVTNIGDNAFVHCSVLEKIYYNGSEDEWNRISIGDGAIPSHTEIIFWEKTPKPDTPIANPFIDVKPDQWYTDGILWCYQNEYMAGVSDTEFGRKSNVTRAMFATILAKIDGSDISGYSKMSFTDVKAGQWYSNAIEWAASNGYAAGLGEGIFGYKQNVSREQIALFFYTYSSKNNIDVSDEADLSGYADLNRVHSWALDAVQWAVAKGLISGTSDTTLSPRDSATRAEIALVIKNYVENVKP